MCLHPMKQSELPKSIEIVPRHYSAVPSWMRIILRSRLAEGPDMELCTVIIWYYIICNYYILLLLLCHISQMTESTSMFLQECEDHWKCWNSKDPKNFQWCWCFISSLRNHVLAMGSRWKPAALCCPVHHRCNVTCTLGGVLHSCCECVLIEILFDIVIVQQCSTLYLSVSFSIS